MTETTAGKIVRPSFDEAYNNMTGLDDAAITEHLGYDIEELFERLNDGALSTRGWKELVESLEFLELRRKPNTPDPLAAQLIREMSRKTLGAHMDAYLITSGLMADGDDKVDPESPEGKDSPLSETPASPSTTPAPPSGDESSASPV